MVYRERPILTLLTTAAARWLPVGMLLLASILLPAATPPGTPIVNRAQAETRFADASVVTVNSPEVRTLVGAVSSLELLKSAAPEPVRVGTLLTYTLRYRNTGSTAATGLRIEDDVPAGTQLVPASLGGNATVNGTRVTWTLGTLAAGAGGDVTFAVTVDAATADGVHLRNVGLISSDQEQPTPSNETFSTVVRTPGVIEFQNCDTWTLATVFRRGQSIGIQVTDLDQNIDPQRIETVTVIVNTQGLNPGDRETVILTETGPDTGVFRICIPSNTLAAGAVNDGILSLGTISGVSLEAVYTDPLDTSVVSQTSALIDPLGVVFDSVTGELIQGVTITIIDTATNQPAVLPDLPGGQPQPSTITTGADGAYAFPLVPPGTYRFKVTLPSGSTYTFPSQVPNTNMPAGFTVESGSRGESFTLNVGDPPLVLDIPVDPQPGTHLRVLKTANRAEAEIGDVVRYAVTVSNGSQTPVTGISVFDQLPYGFSYVSGSTRVNGVKAADPTVSQRTITWAIGDLAAGKTCAIAYKAMLGPRSPQGNGRNSAYAQGTAAGKTVTSNRAWVEVKVEPGVFTSKGTVIGKVFIDQDGDRVQTEGEPGVAKAVLYMEDGTRVVTDDEGRFSIPEVAPGTHVLRLDESSLPPGLLPVPVSNRFMGSATSQFVDMAFGGLFKANFALVRTDPAPSETRGAAPGPAEAGTTSLVSRTDKLVVPPSGGVLGHTNTAPAKDAPLEEQILSMTPDLDILAPADGAAMERRHIRVLVKGGSEASIELFVNDAKIDPKKVGRRVTHPERRVAIIEYVSVALEAGAANRIKAQLRDPFGNVRGTKEITVYTAGVSADMTIEPEQEEIPADGTSTTPVKVRLLDRDGRVVRGDRMMTVELSAGEIVEPDADPVRPGTQVPCRDGVGVFTVRAPRDAGEARIGIDCDGIADSAPIFYGPNLRKMIVVGSGDLTIGGSRSGAPNYLDELYDGQDARTGRGAFFLKGDVGRGFLLTAAYDSAKEKSDELEDIYRQTVNDPEYKDRYPTYGDDSELGYEAKSREKLYLRVDKGRSYAMFGDYQTDLNQTTLAAYNRTFTGLVADLATDKAKFRGFVSRTDQTLVVDTIPGRGISGLYYLSAPPVAGSERVSIEVRDRYRPDRVLSREDVARDSDFEIDYDMRTLLFARPVPSHDADMNPVFIIARYEAEGGTDRKNYTYGGRGAIMPLAWLELGATAVTEQKDEGDFVLQGTDATLKLPLNSTLKAEYARTEALFDLDGAIEVHPGTARAVEFKSEPSPTLTLAGYYRDADDFFGNPSAVDVSRGNFKYGIGGTHQATDSVKIKAEHFYEEDRLNDSDSRHSSVTVERTFGKATTANLGVLHETSHRVTANPFAYPGNNPFTGPSSTANPGFAARPTLTTRTPFDIGADVPENLTAITAGIETPVLKDRIDLRLSHRQDVTGGSHNLSQAELALRITDKHRAYLRQEYGSYDERDEWRTALGTESEIAPKTVNYNEYRMESAETGRTHQKVIGARHDWTFDERLSGNVAAEHLSTVRGPERAGEPDALALAGSAEYKLAKTTRLRLRLEYRNATDEESILAEFGGTHRINRELTLLGRERFFYNVFDQYGERLTSRTLLGLAYRPTRFDRFHALAKMEYRYDDENLKSDAGMPAVAATTNAWIGSFEGHYQATRKLQLIGRYAGKLTLDDDVNAYTDLIAGRLLYDLTDRWDVGLEYRLFTNHQTSEIVSGGAVELGYRVWKDLWASVGYSVDSIDSDLTDSHWGKGPYVRLRFKFDENTLRNLRSGGW